MQAPSLPPTDASNSSVIVDDDLWFEGVGGGHGRDAGHLVGSLRAPDALGVLRPERHSADKRLAETVTVHIALGCEVNRFESCRLVRQRRLGLAGAVPGDSRQASTVPGGGKSSSSHAAIPLWERRSRSTLAGTLADTALHRFTRGLFRLARPLGKVEGIAVAPRAPRRRASRVRALREIAPAANSCPGGKTIHGGATPSLAEPSRSAKTAKHLRASGDSSAMASMAVNPRSR